MAIMLEGVGRVKAVRHMPSVRTWDGGAILPAKAMIEVILYVDGNHFELDEVDGKKCQMHLALEPIAEELS